MINRKGRKLILIALTVAVCVMMCASAFAADSIFPDFQPDLGEVTPMPEPTLVPDETPVFDYYQTTPDKSSVNDKAQQVDHLTIYAPAGFKFRFSWNAALFDDGSFDYANPFWEYYFEGKGSEEPSLVVPYSAFHDILCDFVPLFVLETSTSGYLYNVAISNSFGTLVPSFPNEWINFDANSNGSCHMSFIVTAMKFGNVFFLNLVDSNGNLVEGMYSESTPTPLPVESVSVPSLEQGREIMDIVSINNGVSFMGKLFELVYDLFPYYVMIMAICVFMLIIQIVVR